MLEKNKGLFASKPQQCLPYGPSSSNSSHCSACFATRKLNLEMHSNNTKTLSLHTLCSISLIYVQYAFNLLSIYQKTGKTQEQRWTVDKDHLNHLISSLSQPLFIFVPFPASVRPEFPHVPSLHGALAAASDSQRNAPCVGDQSPRPCGSGSGLDIIQRYDLSDIVML